MINDDDDFLCGDMPEIQLWPLMLIFVVVVIVLALIFA